jgi:Histidine kinase-, DNA gyrase B-, and HSP90-like ATPase
MDRSILNNFPNCDLIEVLVEKASQRHDIKFDFIGRLDDFRERVSGEVRQINLLFPEYTPHEEEYHLSKLFHVASLVLGRDRLEAMNSAELFILTLSLYGHDWGMAVSESEKELILSKNKSMDSSDIWVLPDEKSRISKFLKNQGIKLDNSEKEIATELWREYVRQTHAFRSGERVRKYFEQIDGGIADAASRVCEGHWLDFEDLQDYHRYPPDYSVLRESVNLRALAVYLRLIDLLDLSEDRTPYVIWKYVAPRDPRSKMEWAKHRSLRAITCPPYQQGRIIQVDGSTDDHEVYAALEDLKIWCEQQLRGCNDILARMNDSRHQLDIYHIDWRVTPRGFKPILIQFEFDRRRMFEILGDDIYQGDSYVFLRELLQNSIDAIRVRREVLKRNGIIPGEIGTIRVNVEHGQNGDAIVTWEDDGIGMDDYIIRNYFAVAGKSYYRSADFEREGLKIDPISRFGIGFLSCFMVADHVEIKTFKDPYLPPSSEPLHIKIPAMHRQFRVETETRESALPGTKIKVFVDGKKLKANPKTSNLIERLDVTSYLSKIAGFVEFPIIINEDESKTIIIHPNHDHSDFTLRFGERYIIKKIDQTFSLSNEVLPQDLPSAQEFITEKYFDLSTDLKLDGYEGKVAFFIPSEMVADLTLESDSSLIKTKKGSNYHVRWKRVEEITFDKSLRLFSRSATVQPHNRVFRDGILIPDASKNPRYTGRNGPRITVNLLKSNSERIDLARTQILNETNHWSDPIFDALLENLNLGSLLELAPADRLYKLSWIASYYHFPIGKLWSNFPQGSWPVAVLNKKNQLEILDWNNLSSPSIQLAPNTLSYTELFAAKLFGDKRKGGILHKWAGKPCFITDIDFTYSSEGILNSTLNIIRYPITKAYTESEVRFLTPPFENLPPLMQEVYIRKEKENDVIDEDTIVERLLDDISSVTLSAVRYLGSYRRRTYGSERVVRGIVQFDKKHRNLFAYGSKYLNFTHPTTQTIIRCAAIPLLSTTQSNKLDLEMVGKIQDALEEINYIGRNLFYGHMFDVVPYDQFCDKLSTLFSLANKFELFDIKLEKLIPTPDEFINGTIRERNGKLELISYSNFATVKKSKQKIKSFGEPIKD